MRLDARNVFGTLALGLATLAGAAPATGQSVAAIDFGAASIDFRPLGAYERAVLTLSVPDGQVIRREFDTHTAISIDLRDLLGSNLPEGSYRMELHLQPKLDAVIQHELAAARERGDETAVERLRSQGRLPAPRIERSFFSVVGGTVIAPGQPEPVLRAQGREPGLAPKDTIAESLCVGSDCPGVASFSDTTLLLMANNTRIKFDDSSTSTGFTTRDWELEANSSVSGGPNYFAIHDCGTSSQGGCADDPLVMIEAGAPANSLFVDSTGRIGFRTSTPVADLHISTSNTPTLRLEQNSSGGFTAQNWDIGGHDAYFFVRDSTHSNRLPLRIRPGAPTSSLDIAADGDLGVGTASPSASVDVLRSAVAAEVQATTFSDDGDQFSNMVLRRALGTSGAPTAVSNNSILGTFSFRGYTGSGFATDNNARLEVRAEQGFTTTAQGTRMIFQTTANNTTTPQTRMVIKNDGKVGINTTSPTEQLHVNGAVRATSFINPVGPEGGADYVFEPGYELMPLEHLDAFVSENKHLPGIPSAEEMEARGINLAELQIKLLAKIEELTLYTLEQHQIITELKTRLAALEQARP